MIEMELPRLGVPNRMRVQSKRLKSIPALILVAGLGALCLPERGQSYNLSGDVLDLTQRHFRIMNGFLDPEANDNLVPDPDFPGSLGAELAIRKAVAEWGSGPHGTGGSDPTQHEIGSGGANFDAFYSGRAGVPGGTNGNIFSVINVLSSILAFTEIPSSDGWRIRFFEDPKDWNDGPDGILSGVDPMDIQGIACHEYGHALGLQHSAEVEATMHGNVPSDLAISHRSLHADDVLGVQAIYGQKSTTKPTITGVSWQGGLVTLEGTGFHPTANEIWFTQAQAPAHRHVLRKGGIPSSLQGTRITLLPPSNAGAGDVVVRLPGLSAQDLSNAFPYDPGVDFGWTPPEHYGAGGTTSAGIFQLQWQSLPAASAGTFRVSFDGVAPGVPVILFRGDAPASLNSPLGNLLVAGPLERALWTVSDSNGEGLMQVPIASAGPGLLQYYQAWVLDPAVIAGAALSNGLVVEIQP